MATGMTNAKPNGGSGTCSVLPRRASGAGFHVACRDVVERGVRIGAAPRTAAEVFRPSHVSPISSRAEDEGRFPGGAAGD